MARLLPIERVGRWCHVTSRGNERKAIYRNDRDREHFVELLEEMVAVFRVRLHGYVMMENHFHLLVATNARRHERRLETDAAERGKRSKVLQLLNCKI